MTDLETPKIINPFRRELDIQPPDIRHVMDKYEGREKSYLRETIEKHPSTSFMYDSPFGRTLSARNKTGKNIRRAGMVLLALGASVVGIPFDSMVTNVSDTKGLEFLETVEMIVLMIGAILVALGIGSDKIEMILQRRDELKILN